MRDRLATSIHTAAESLMKDTRMVFPMKPFIKNLNKLLRKGRKK